MGELNSRISERPVSMGPRSALIGVLTQGVDARPLLPGIVALNSGILPRWGRGRIYVTLARRLGHLGFRFLRFDLSGIGDSPPRDDGLPLADAALADVGDALDWFVGERQPVVLIGLCDGANLAAYQASIDDRVVGAILIDPLIPRTPRYRIEHLWRRLWSGTTWRELLSGQHAGWRIVRARAKAAATGAEALRAVNPNDPAIRAQLSGMYRLLSERKVPVLALFSGGMQHRHCYREQIFEAFPEVRFQPEFEVEYFQANDHHFEWPSHRAWFIDRVSEWMTTTFDIAALPAEDAASGAEAEAPVEVARSGDRLRDPETFAI